MSLFERLSGVVICRALTDLFLHDSSWRHINIRSSFPDESAKIKCAQPHSEGGQTVRVVPTAGLEEIELEAEGLNIYPDLQGPGGSIKMDNVMQDRRGKVKIIDV